MNKRTIAFVFLLCLSVLQCGKKEKPESTEAVLARIAGKNIFVSEFIRRAEYTPRPAYCRSDNYIHKKIVLNSLIAEKLLALEAGEGNALLRQEEFQLYLQGRQEQAMRQWQFHQEAYQKVQLDTSEVKNAYHAAGRTYTIAYYTIKDSSIANLLRTEMASRGKSFEQLYYETGALASLPQREVAWESPEQDAIHEALFSRALNKGEVLGPLPVANQQFVMMKILGWTEQVAVSNSQVQSRWQEVSEKLTLRRSAALYQQYAAEVMRGKTLEFSPQTFRKLVAIAGPIYVKSSEEQQEALHQQFWGEAASDSAGQQMGKNLEVILDEPLFRIDGQIWTVRDLEHEMKIHPLVFREKKLKQSEFAEQFKLAIVDLVRDRYLTQAAYQKGYDRAEAVQRNVEMWKDNLLFLHQQKQYLKSLSKDHDFKREYLKIIAADLNPYVDRLQARYAQAIQIDMEAFEKIKLTGLDMFVLRRQDPFPVVVPNFPIITTDSQLDYGRKMN